MKTQRANQPNVVENPVVPSSTEHQEKRTSNAAVASKATFLASPLRGTAQSKDVGSVGSLVSKRETNAPKFKAAATAVPRSNRAPDNAVAANLSGAGRVRAAAASFFGSVVSLAKTSGARTETSGLKRLLGMGSRMPTDPNGQVKASARNLIKAAQIPKQSKHNELKATNAWSGVAPKTVTPLVSDESIPYCLTTAEAAMLKAVRDMKRDDPENFRSVAVWLGTEEGRKLGNDIAGLETELASLGAGATEQAVTSLAGARRASPRSETEGSARSSDRRRNTPAPAKGKASFAEASFNFCGPTTVLQLVAGHDAVDQLAPSWLEAQRLSSSLATPPLEIELSASAVLASIKKARNADAELTGDRLLDQVKAIGAISTESVRKSEILRLINAWDREPSMMQRAKQIPDKQFFALKALFEAMTAPEKRQPKAMTVAAVERRACKTIESAGSGSKSMPENGSGSASAGTLASVPTDIVGSAVGELAKALQQKNGVRHPIVMSPRPAEVSNRRLKRQLESLLLHPSFNIALQTMTTVEYREVEEAFKEVNMPPPTAERKLTPRLASTDVKVAAERLLINIERIAATPRFFGALEQNDFRYCFTAPRDNDMAVVLQHCTNEQLVRFSNALMQNGDTLPPVVAKDLIRRLKAEAQGVSAARPKMEGSNETDWEAYGNLAISQLGRLASLEQLTGALAENLRRHTSEDPPEDLAAARETNNTNEAAEKLIAQIRGRADAIVSRHKRWVEVLPEFSNELSPETLIAWTKVADALVDRDASFESAALRFRDAARMHAPSLIKLLAAALEDYGYEKSSQSERVACGRRVINVLGDMAELSIRRKAVAGGPERAREISAALRTAALSDCAVITAMLGSGLLRQIWSSASILAESGTCMADPNSLFSGLMDALAGLKGDGQLDPQRETALMPTELQGYMVNAVGIALPTTFASAEAVTSANVVMGPDDDPDSEIRHQRLVDAQRSFNIVGEVSVERQAKQEDMLAEIDKLGTELVGPKNFSLLQKWCGQTMGNAGIVGVAYDARKAWVDSGRAPEDFCDAEFAPPLFPRDSFDPQRLLKVGADAALVHSTSKTFRSGNGDYVGSASVAVKVTADAHGCRLTTIVHGKADALDDDGLATKTPEFLNREKRMSSVRRASQEARENEQAAAMRSVIAELDSMGLPKSLQAFVQVTDPTQLDVLEAAAIANNLPTGSEREKLAYSLLPLASNLSASGQLKMNWVAPSGLSLNEDEVNQSFTDGFMRMDELGHALSETELFPDSGIFGPVFDLGVREDGTLDDDKSSELRRRAFALHARLPMALAIKVRDHFLSMVVQHDEQSGKLAIVVADTDSRPTDPDVHRRRIDAIRGALRIGALNKEKIVFKVVSSGLQQQVAMANACGPLSLLLIAGFMARSKRSPNGETFEGYASTTMDALLALPLDRRSRMVAALRAHSAAGRLMEEANVNPLHNASSTVPKVADSNTPPVSDSTTPQLADTANRQIANSTTPQLAESVSPQAAGSVPWRGARATLMGLQKKKLAESGEKAVPVAPSAAQIKMLK